MPMITLKQCPLARLASLGVLCRRSYHFTDTVNGSVALSGVFGSRKQMEVLRFIVFVLSPLL